MASLASPHHAPSSPKSPVFDLWIGSCCPLDGRLARRQIVHMKKIDHGLGAIGLLLLFTILACVLVSWLPVIKSEPPAHTSDWLGFAGGAVGGFMTLVAAGIAWIAVQRQISVQTAISASQNAIQTFNILSEEDRYLAHDYYMCGQVALASDYFTPVLDNWFSQTDPNVIWIDAVKEVFDKRIADFDSALTAFDSATENKSAFPNAAAARHDVVVAGFGLRKAAIAIAGNIKMAKLKFEGGDNTWRDNWAATKATDIRTWIANCKECAAHYRDLIHNERMRVVALKREIRDREMF
ncbi:hypothetical protein V1291_005164 [Nitrobacteraceae bacterium AZCC 1564]